MKKIHCCTIIPILIALFITIPTAATEYPTPPKTTWEEMWSLQLVNNNHLISQDVSIEFMYFDGEKVDARAGVYYAEMVQAAKQDGITLYLRSGYRSISTQRTIYQQALDRYMGYGYSYATAVSIANRYYTIPGGSEHNIGLAFDIITPEYHNTVYNLNSSFANTAAYYWLIANCADFGFILSYPEHRTDETGINFEPWHYRYVGVEHAQYIMNHDLLLEEYVTLYQATYPELYSDSPPETSVPEESPEIYIPEEENSLIFHWEKAHWVHNQLESVFGAMLPSLSEIQEKLEYIQTLK